MFLPAEPYQSPEEPFVAAVHNAGHALGCIATGRAFPFAVSAQVCRGNPLGLERGPDRFGWAVICWAGPAAEAVAAIRSGTSERDAAEWIWTLFQAFYSGAATGDYPGAAATDPAVVAVALSVADANWTGIERIASALTVSAGSGGPVPWLSPAQVMTLIGSRGGADIGAAFESWQLGIAEVKERRSQGAGLRWP